MDDLLRDLLDALEAVSLTHEEIFDTVCREKMSDPIFFLFIKPESGYVAPDDYGLIGHDANHAVKEALLTYIEAANVHAGQNGRTSFHDRLAAFQNEDLKSSGGHNYYDDFFGWMNPKNFDADGNVIDNR